MGFVKDVAKVGLGVATSPLGFALSSLNKKKPTTPLQPTMISSASTRPTSMIGGRY